MKQNLVVIGNGMAGARLLEELIASKTDLYNITVFGSEPYGNYNRIMLSPLLAGDKILDDIITHPKQWYSDNSITLHTGTAKSIVKIDRLNKYVITQDGTRCHYHRLVIATGSRPFMLPIPGNDLEGVLSFRDIADVENMIDAASRYRNAVVIGAGLLGLEAAMGLLSRGMHVTVVHHNDVPLNRQLDKEASELLKADLIQRGMAFKMNATTSAIIAENNHVSKIQFKDGSELETDLVVMAIGIRPNMQLAEQAGIYCEKGIVVNDNLQTYDPSIYALGECIQHRQQTFGLVAPLFDQAKVLANHLCEHGVARYQTLSSATKLKVTGIQVFSVGDYLGNEQSELLFFRDKKKGVYKKLVIEENRLVGAVLYGDTLEGAFYHELVDSGENISAFRSSLMFGRALCRTDEQASGEIQ